MATQIQPNFTLEEFTGGKPVSDYVRVNVMLLARHLQTLRNHFGLPIKIIEGVSNKTAEHREGKAAVISIAGKTAEQIRAGMEGRVYNGAIGLLPNNQVYYSLVPIGARWDQRGNAPVPNPPVNTNPGTPGPSTDGSNQTNKALILSAMALGLFLVAKTTFKQKKK